MARKLFALLVLLGVVASLPAQAGKAVILRWHGQSFFSLETSQGTRVVFDPHAIEGYGRQTQKAEIILVSHFHNDHTQVGVIENYQKAKIIAGLKGTPKKPEWNIVDEKVHDVRIRSVGTYHDTTQGMERGKNAVFIVEADGMRFVHLGDVGHGLSAEQVEQVLGKDKAGKPGTIDVLMVPVGGIYTINGSEAKKIVEQLKPKKYILPMHYGTKVFDEVLGPEEFLDEQKKENVRKAENTNKLVVEPESKPNEPQIVLLGWK